MSGFASARKVQQQFQCGAHVTLGAGHIGMQCDRHFRRLKQAELCLVGEIVSGHFLFRHRVADDADHAQPWILRVQRLPIDSQSLQRRRPERCKQQVSVGKKVMELFAAYGGLQVQ